MRGTGSLKRLIGQPTHKPRKGQEEAEPELAAPPVPKRQAKRNTAAAPDQSFIFSFFQPTASTKQHAPAARGATAAAAATPQQQRSTSERPPLDAAAAAASQGTAEAEPSPPCSSSISPPPPASQLVQLAQRGAPLLVAARVVGRQHQAAGAWPPARDATLTLQREPDNRVDPRAILVCSTTSAGPELRVHGHLPARVACQLAPLLDAASVAITVGSSSPPPAAAPSQHQQQQSEPPPATVELHVSVSATVLDQADPQAAEAVVAAVERAAAAGRESLAPSRSSGTLLSEAFGHILQQTQQHDVHLLSTHEQQVLHHMQVLPAPCKALLLRLLLRKRTWFQLASLSYAEVAEPHVAASRLAAVGLLLRDSDAAADLHALLAELTLPVLKTVLSSLLPRGHPAVQAAMAGSNGGSGGPNKAALIASIKANASRARLQAAISAAAGPCVTISPAAADTFNRLQLIYFASPGQDISMFVAVERGGARYPPYPISRTRSAFPSRQVLLEYEEALALATRVDAALEAGTLDEATLQPALAALHAGAHKAVVWDEACAPMPNPPPHAAAATAEQQQEQEQQQQEPGQSSSMCVSPCAAGADDSRVPTTAPASDSGDVEMCTEAAGVEATRAAAVESGALGRRSSAAGTGSGSLGAAPQASSSTVSWGTSDSPLPRATAEEGAPPAAAATSSPTAGAAAPPTDAAAPPADAAAAAGPPPLFLARFSPGWVHASLGTVAVSLLEKRKAWGEACELLRLLLGGNACVARRGEWWSRLAINLQHLGRTEDALEAVEAALADSWVRGGDLLGLQRRLLRLGKPPRRWKRPSWATAVGWEPPEVVITARPLANPTGGKSRFYSLDGSSSTTVSVEELALQHYASDAGGGWCGLHSEGGVWATLFGLLLWDVLFMGLPDVFRCPFQTSPLDLDTDAFYPARRDRLDQQLTRIADGQAGAILSGVWAAHAGIFARGVSWQRFSQAQLLEICECVGGLGLAAVLRLMAEDHAGATGGLPDLLLWRPGPVNKAAKMSEVKGPRDRLSHQQRFWLAHMANGTIEVEVFKVKEPPAAAGAGPGERN